jgi:hypothetical protein
MDIVVEKNQGATESLRLHQTHCISWIDTMAPLFSTIAGLTLASIALCSPLTSPLDPLAVDATTPCAKVSALTAGKKAGDRPRVPAQLAHDCITSVPFNQTTAIKLIDSIKPYFKWQSTTPWLADPPKEYAEKVQPPIDLWARLQEVRDKAVAKAYKNEYEASYCYPVESNLVLAC